jgi:cytochrome c oxidase subunit IV
MTHITPVRTYVLVLVALLTLTATTTAVAFVDLGSMNAPVALVIAAAKGTIVALLFMHLRESSHLSVAVVVAALLWLGILLALTMNDYLTRTFLTFG